ncbi:MAG TPA: VTC domain-containing protein, partial [Anaerohalosphaeraceae bacterium]|nr:VTC domain-containing protein [Anaerohalosphaeraceae bacterium]
MAADEKNDVLNAVQSSSSASLDIVRRRRQGVPAEPTLQGSIKPRLQLQKIQPAPDTTLLCRYELKYRIPETKARAIAQYVSAFIHPDRYAKNKPGNEYLISSLYLDTPTLTLCNETLQGKKNRFKLRIRGYDDNPLSPVFLEIKRRACNVIVKS